MNEIYNQNTIFFKALADEKRLMIIDMLSCGELCACQILEQFNVTQPTLSHHMKILCDCNLVIARREGKWMYYSLNNETVQKFKNFLCFITTNSDDCICKDGTCDCTKNNN